MSNIPSIHRDFDVISNEQDLETLYTYKNFPVFMGCVDTPIEEDLFHDMRWQISKSTGMIQLNPLIPLDILYKTEHGSGTTGKLWDEHHEAFCQFIAKYKPSSVLEIGGGSGILAQKYLKLGLPVDWTIIEPNPRVPSILPVNVIRGFFDENFVSEKKFGAVVHSHLLEHIYDPRNFIKHIANFSDVGSKMMFSIPNMKVMMERKYTNCINFEHTTLLTETYIMFLLSKFNYKIVDRQYFKDDHSIFYCVEKVNYSCECCIPQYLHYYPNKKLFLDYIEYHENLIKRLNDITQSTKSSVYLFGAHIFSQYLISYGLNTDKILFVLDNDVRKQEKRLYGTNLMVKSPRILEGVDNGIVILKAGVYNDEIKQDVLKNINPNIIFIE